MASTVKTESQNRQSYLKNDGPGGDDGTFGAAGIDCIGSRLHEFYPNQKNHLQATAMVKFWLGGPDPLDYISMMLNTGDPGKGIPQHWHYVSFGFSDLHGDGRVHQYTGANQQSGFGFELTFRLRRESGQDSAPLWPAHLMNSLARYVFKTGNNLNVGDHVPWYRSLDGESHSAIQHMLIVEDPQLKSLDTPFGSFQFRQIVGVASAEMKAAQRWKGSGVLGLLAKVPQAAGPYYVTDIRRHHSIFDTNPNLMQTVMESIEEEGSNLGHVTAMCQWDDGSKHNTSLNTPKSDEERILSAVHLKFDIEAAELLPLVAKGRLLKGKYFVYQNVAGNVIIFIPPEFDADMVTVDDKHPLKGSGDALQIYCSQHFAMQMAHSLDMFQRPQEAARHLPRTFQLKQPNVTISIYPSGQLGSQ